MKKKTSGLMLTFSTVAVAIAAAGCVPREDVQTMAFQDVQSCETANAVSRDECVRAFSVAKGEHESVAPKYQSLNDCRDEFDNCEITQVSDGNGGYTSMFIPAMAGFMLGRALDSSSSKSVPYQPLYQTKRDRRSGLFSTAGGRSVSSGLNRGSSRHFSAPKPSIRPVGRGGFGASARGSVSS